MGLFGRANNKKSDLAAEVAATYSMQYMLDHGSMPSRDKVTEWIMTMEGLSEMEILELGSDTDKCKRVLR
jgi:hypothetical protein